jgi:uncharacterized repeat protein (TIGR01451 family)
VTGRILALDEPQPNLFTSDKRVIDADGDGIAQAGDVLTYTVTITNSGDHGAGILLTDTLPTGVTYLSGSLRFDFPGLGFTATVANNVLVAHTANDLQPSADESLPAGGQATLVYGAQVSNPAPAGDHISNTVELRDQFAVYAISPAVLPLPPMHKVLLPLIVR